MAKPLRFRFADQEIAVHLNKVDRAKLYGFKEVQVLDEQDRKCDLATLADDGRTIVGRGGTGLGDLAADGQWCDKKQLTPVDQDGNEITPVPSSFSAPVELAEKASIDDYLSHNVRLVYALESEDDLAPLQAELERGTLFKFPYSYRGGLEADAGFLLLGEDGQVYLAVGNPTKIEFLGLQQLAAVVPEEEEDMEEETDLMDFGMM